jgi:hypothetical protein
LAARKKGSVAAEPRFRDEEPPGPVVQGPEKLSVVLVVRKDPGWRGKTARASVVAMRYRRAAMGTGAGDCRPTCPYNFPGRRKFRWAHLPPATMAVAVSPPAVMTMVVVTMVVVVIGLRNQRVSCGCLADCVEIGRNSRRRRDADKTQSDHCECGQDDGSHCFSPLRLTTHCDRPL